MLNMKNTYTNRYQLERLLLSIRKKNSSVWTAEVLNSETIQPFVQQRFSAWQMAPDQIQLFVRLFIICIPVTPLSQTTSLCWCMFQKQYSTDVKIFVVSFTFITHKLTNKTPKHLTFCLSFQLRHYETLGNQNMHSSLLRFHQAISVTLSTNPVFNLEPADKCYCYKTT